MKMMQEASPRVTTDSQPNEVALEVRASKTSDDSARDEFVRAHSRGSFFHLRGWTRFVGNVHGHRQRDLLAWRGDKLVGVLPLMEGRGMDLRRQLISAPYAVYGGAIAEDRGSELALLDSAKELARSLGVGHLELRYRKDPEIELPGSDLYATFIRDLPDEPGDILALMPKKARAEARKARNRYGLELSRGVWYVDDLVRLFFQNKQALGSPALPHAHFRAILEEFDEEHIFVHLVRRRGTPIAAVMSFAFEDTLIAYYAGTQPGADREFSASNYMYMALQEWGVEHGFKKFDFCRSRQGSGAFRFKEHQGFTAQSLNYRYFLVKRKNLPTFTPSNSRTAFLRKTWTKLPSWIARRASNVLSHYLS